MYLNKFRDYQHWEGAIFAYHEKKFNDPNFHGNIKTSIYLPLIIRFLI